MDIESIRSALHEWEDAADGPSEDAEHEAALGMADVLRAVLADCDLGKGAK
jgi:hypothetical protein